MGRILNDGTGGCIGYEYTTGGQLVGVRRYVDDNGNWVLDEAAPEITYTLDAVGRRAVKLVDGTIQERYLWAGHNTALLAVYGPTGTTPIARFEYGVGHLPVRMRQGSVIYYFAYDQVGSLRAVFDDTGALVHEITYDSYGNILSETTAQGYGDLCLPFGFAGGLHDRDTDLVLFGFRDYDPETGAWMTTDPIGFAGGDTYLYAYCGGDPVNWVDPDGLLPGFGDYLLSHAYNSIVQSPFVEGAVDGAQQYIDTFIPFADPFLSSGYYDPNAPGMYAGKIASTVSTEIFRSVALGAAVQIGTSLNFVRNMKGIGTTSGLFRNARGAESIGKKGAGFFNRGNAIRFGWFQDPQLTRRISLLNGNKHLMNFGLHGGKPATKLHWHLPLSEMASLGHLWDRITSKISM